MLMTNTGIASLYAIINERQDYGHTFFKKNLINTLLAGPDHMNSTPSITTTPSAVGKLSLWWQNYIKTPWHNNGRKITLGTTGLVALLILLSWYRRQQRRKYLLSTADDKQLANVHLKIPNPLLDKPNHFQVLIIGAGAAGTSCAYLLAKRYRIKSVILEKDLFPREKYASNFSDIINGEMLEEFHKMGILEEMKSEGFVLPIQTIQFSATNNQSIPFALNPSHATKSKIIKRSVWNEKLLQAAQNLGVEVKQGHNVVTFRYSPADKNWIVKCEVITTNQEGVTSIETKQFTTRMLIVAEGASATLCKLVKIRKENSEAWYSQTYIRQTTVNDETLPDLSVLYTKKLNSINGQYGITTTFKTGENELCVANFYYPRSDRAAPNATDVTNVTKSLIETDTVMKTLITEKAVVEDVRVAQVKVGGTEKTYKEQCLIIGEAAGFIDPMTGCSLRFALQSADIAARTVAQGFDKNNLSEAFLKKYQLIWQEKFGNDFYWSGKLRNMQQSYPIVDAIFSLLKSKGSRFANQLVQLYHGDKSMKEFLFRFDVLLPLLYAIVSLYLFRK